MSARGRPVIEIFGPTIQGEGPDAGRVCSFVRFGGCDFRCSWCDSMYAVEPALVRAAERLTDREVADRVSLLLPGSEQLVVLSGGNPALHELGDLTRILHEEGHRVAVETQGSVWRDWLLDVDTLVISPKPPSAGVPGPSPRFLGKALLNPNSVLKIVCFDAADVTYAAGLHTACPLFPLYLSVGTRLNDDTAAILSRYRWLSETVIATPALANATVLPQLHVLMWGQSRGR